MFWMRKNVSVGMAGLDYLTAWYIRFNIWSRRLYSSLLRIMSFSMVVTDSGCLQWYSIKYRWAVSVVKRATQCWMRSSLSTSPDGNIKCPSFMFPHCTHKGNVCRPFAVY